MKRGTIQHPKTGMLAEALAVPHLMAVGILESLWHWTATYAWRGDIGRWSDAVIRQGVGHDDERLIPALIETGWIDEDATHRLVVHDWADHADEAVRKRLARAGEQFVGGVEPPQSAVRHDRRSARDSVGPVSGQRPDIVETPSRPPVPVPVPDPEPIREGRAPTREADGSESGDGASPPGHKSSGSRVVDMHTALRDPAHPPDPTMDPADWTSACRVADLIESEASVRGMVIAGAGGEARARALLAFVEREHPTKPARIVWPTLDAAVRAMADTMPDDLRAMAAYPDGCYPGKAGQSRLSKACRLLAAVGLAPSLDDRRRWRARA